MKLAKLLSFVPLFSYLLYISPMFAAERAEEHCNCQPQLSELNLFDPTRHIGRDHFIELSRGAGCSKTVPMALSDYGLAMIRLDRGGGIVFTADFASATTENDYFVLGKNAQTADLYIGDKSAEVGWASDMPGRGKQNVATLVVLIRVGEDQDQDQKQNNPEGGNRSEVWERMRLAKWAGRKVERRTDPIPLTREFMDFLNERIVDALVFAPKQNAHVDERIMRQIFARKLDFLKMLKIVTLQRNGTVIGQDGMVTVEGESTVNRCESAETKKGELVMGVMEPNCWGPPTPGMPNQCAEPTQQKPIENLTLRIAILERLRALNHTDEIDDDCTFEQAMNYSIKIFANIWRKGQTNSRIAFQGLLSNLEYWLEHCVESVEYFAKFIDAIGKDAAIFWQTSVPYLYDSDVTNGTMHRDAVAFSLIMYDMNTGSDKLGESYSAIPGIRKYLLGTRAKHFRERFRTMRRFSANPERTEKENQPDNNSNIVGNNNNKIHGPKARRVVVDPLVVPGRQLMLNFDPVVPAASVPGPVPGGTPVPSPPTSPASDTYLDNVASGVVLQKHRQRVINVSNASPVGLRLTQGRWMVKPGSGGLVSCMNPVISSDVENMWLANFGMNVHNVKVTSITSRLCSDRKLKRMGSGHLESPSTNTLGLPVTCQASADLVFHVIADDELKKLSKTELREGKSLLKVLNNHNRGNYKLVPVILREQDYHPYYSGISNGLLWPALHNLPEYISAEYNDPAVLRQHWHSYVRVNYQFALDALRNARAQDFIWIHDYHLMVTGTIMRSLEKNKNLEIGFFLHTPFQAPDELFERYGQCGMAILKGLLNFTKVGYQMHRDRDRFVELVRKHLPEAEFREAKEEKLDVVVITYQGWTSSHGVFPVTIKNEHFLKIAQNPAIIERGREIRKEIFDENSPPDACLFFSAERFDYTKGILGKFKAFERYLEKYPERRGKDVLFQVAATSRQHIEAYDQYQEKCRAVAKRVKERFSDDKAYPGWEPIKLHEDSMGRDELIAHYLAMDVGVVTPRMDGNNLVKKEMVICNPKAGLILSTGAGSEIQVANAGLWSETDPSYHRITEVLDTETFAEAFHAAAMDSPQKRQRHGRKLQQFVMDTDIEKWSASFLDPSWSHLVIPKVTINSMDDYAKLMEQVGYLRRNIVEKVLKGIPVPQHYAVSLKNAVDSLQYFTHFFAHPELPRLKFRLYWMAEMRDKKLMIKTDWKELEKDEQFLKLVQNGDGPFNNEKKFTGMLLLSHPRLIESKFRTEMEASVKMFSDVGHFTFFFAGYPELVNTAYSGVVHAQFAKRYVQTCALIGTGSMKDILEESTLSDGLYYIGASSGRQWVFDNKSGFQKQRSRILNEPDKFQQYLSAHGDDFNKGNGVQVLLWNLSLDVHKGTVLVVGNSEADLPMLHICLKGNPKNVYSVWVVPESNGQLRDRVVELSNQYGNQNFIFVSSTDVLVGAMAEAIQSKMRRQHISSEEIASNAAKGAK